MNTSTQQTNTQQSNTSERDIHARPPQQVRDVYRRYQSMGDEAVNHDPEIIDFSRGLKPEQSQKLNIVQSFSAVTAKETFEAYLGHPPNMNYKSCLAYEHVDFPGLRMFPGLLSPEVQLALVDRLLHRDLSNPLHKTNLHDDYTLPYPCGDTSQSASFFTLPISKSTRLLPRTPDKLRPLDLVQFLHKRWRYLTLGTQYDWATRLYPPKDQVPTEFPPDIAALVSGFLPQVRPESGVVLIYTPKDFMPVHRDVSEMCDRDLCSFSLGCDGLFVLALEHESIKQDDSHFKTIIVRVKSGDMIQLSGSARWAWHAMPKVMAGTCPEFLRHWPVNPHNPKAHSTRWKGYMTDKRINLSCRQVYN